MSKNYKSLLILVALIIILVVLVYALIPWFTVETPDDEEIVEVDEEDTDQTDIDDGITEVDNEDHHDPMEGLVDDTDDLPDVIFNIFGDVTQVGSNFIVIESGGHHMESGDPTQVRVNIVEDRFEVVGEGEDSEEIFIPGTTVLDQDNNEISVSDISVGDEVSVESSSNIKNSTDLDASNIKILI